MSLLDFVVMVTVASKFAGNGANGQKLQRFANKGAVANSLHFDLQTCISSLWCSPMATEQS